MIEFVVIENVPIILVFLNLVGSQMAQNDFKGLKDVFYIFLIFLSLKRKRPVQNCLKILGSQVYLLVDMRSYDVLFSSNNFEKAHVTYIFEPHWSTDSSKILSKIWRTVLSLIFDRSYVLWHYNTQFWAHNFFNARHVKQ